MLPQLRVRWRSQSPCTGEEIYVFGSLPDFFCKLLSPSSLRGMTNFGPWFKSFIWSPGITGWSWRVSWMLFFHFFPFLWLFSSFFSFTSPSSAAPLSFLVLWFDSFIHLFAIFPFYCLTLLSTLPRIPSSATVSLLEVLFILFFPHPVTPPLSQWVGCCSPFFLLLLPFSTTFSLLLVVYWARGTSWGLTVFGPQLCSWKCLRPSPSLAPSPFVCEVFLVFFFLLSVPLLFPSRYSFLRFAGFFRLCGSPSSN